MAEEITTFEEEAPESQEHIHIEVSLLSVK